MLIVLYFVNLESSQRKCFAEIVLIIIKATDQELIRISEIGSV